MKDHILYKRYDVKRGRSAPKGFIPAQYPDPVTGHYPGWLVIDKNNPADKWHYEAYDPSIPDGSYELIGPKVQGNKYHLQTHMLIKHGSTFFNTPRTFEGIKEFL